MFSHPHPSCARPPGRVAARPAPQARAASRSCSAGPSRGGRTAASGRSLGAGSRAPPPPVPGSRLRRRAKRAPAEGHSRICALSLRPCRALARICAGAEAHAGQAIRRRSTRVSMAQIRRRGTIDAGGAAAQIGRRIRRPGLW
ncbi:hypothetical protein PVAP13_3NG238200 [Panicum virgatum]|uniref:Uncharacterized protein n=1 Tax=Panicum virgatum TaxID=38727 RepID=A0A8T0UKR3_PANVG|nr:hypothetical protein PVAP13_3NG238200 [Panicum virgatum]